MMRMSKSVVETPAVAGTCDEALSATVERLARLSLVQAYSDKLTFRAPALGLTATYINDDRRHGMAGHFRLVWRSPCCGAYLMGQAGLACCETCGEGEYDFPPHCDDVNQLASYFEACIAVRAEDPALDPLTLALVASAMRDNLWRLVRIHDRATNEQ